MSSGVVSSLRKSDRHYFGAPDVGRLPASGPAHNVSGSPIPSHRSGERTMNVLRISGAVALLLPALLAAQAPASAPAMNPNPVATAAQRINTRYSGFLLAAADQVPADKLGYKPTPAQLSFGDVWAHLVEANFGICGAIAGTPAANVPKVKGTDSKDALVAALKASFTYCDGVLAKTTDGNLGETVDMGFM